MIVNVQSLIYLLFLHMKEGRKIGSDSG